MSYDARPLKIMLPGSSNVLCTYLSMLCIYLACRHRKRLIILFRLAQLWLIGNCGFIENCTLFQTLCGCRFGHGRAKQQPGPLAFGSWTLFSIGLQAGSQACRTSWQAKRGPRRSLKVARQQPLDFGTTNLSRRGSSRTRSNASFVSSIKRK